MSEALEKAQAEYSAGRYKRAVDTLWEVNFASDDGEAEARSLITLATHLRDSTQGSLRDECERHIARAEQYLAPSPVPPNLAPAEQILQEDPVALARRAREAGLTWLEIVRAEDVVASEMHVGLEASTSGGTPEPALIDAVEAEGWRFEHLACLFRPIKVQSSPLRGADFWGGEPVEGEERYLYLFRRVDGASG